MSRDFLREQSAGPEGCPPPQDANEQTSAAQAPCTTGGLGASLAAPGGTGSTRKVVAKTTTGTSGVLEVPAVVGGPSRTRTLDPLIKSESGRTSTEAHDDLKLEDLYIWD